MGDHVMRPLSCARRLALDVWAGPGLRDGRHPNSDHVADPACRAGCLEAVIPQQRGAYEPQSLPAGSSNMKFKSKIMNIMS
jgi:hypothetical protein